MFKPSTCPENPDRYRVTKRWTTKKGRETGGKPFTKNALYRLRPRHQDRRCGTHPWHRA